MIMTLRLSLQQIFWRCIPAPMLARGQEPRLTAPSSATQALTGAAGRRISSISPGFDETMLWQT